MRENLQNILTEKIEKKYPEIVEEFDKYVNFVKNYPPKISNFDVLGFQAKRNEKSKNEILNLPEELQEKIYQAVDILKANLSDSQEEYTLARYGYIIYKQLSNI